MHWSIPVGEMHSRLVSTNRWLRMNKEWYTCMRLVQVICNEWRERTNGYLCQRPICVTRCLQLLALLQLQNTSATDCCQTIDDLIHPLWLFNSHEMQVNAWLVSFVIIYFPAGLWRLTLMVNPSLFMWPVMQQPKKRSKLNDLQAHRHKQSAIELI